MRTITLGTTGISSVQNAFGALPIQRVSEEEAVRLLRKAYDGGMTFYDTARNYSDSEKKVGMAFEGMRDKIVIATKTGAKTPEGFRKDLETSLGLLKTDHIDIYQFHMAGQCYRPDDGTGMYEEMLKAKKEGKILHIAITAHKLQVAIDAVKSGLYETLQYPFSYLADPKEKELVCLCRERNVGFIAMKGMAGGLITRSDAAMAFMDMYDHVLPIWGVQRDRELDEWLSYMDHTPEMTPEIAEFIEKERGTLVGDFCRGCGYCQPCPAGIEIASCARMSLMLRRAPSAAWLDDVNQAKMSKIPDCLNCGMCTKRCPYSLNTPELLKKNYEDYQNVLAGRAYVGV